MTQATPIPGSEPRPGPGPGVDPTEEYPQADFGPVEMTLSRRLPGVLKIVIRGRGGDQPAALRRWRHNLARAGELGLKRLLVVLDLGGPTISERGLAAMVATLASEFDLDGFRIAVVQTRHQRLPQDERGMLLAIEHGVATRVFSDQDTALVWLRHGAD